MREVEGLEVDQLFEAGEIGDLPTEASSVRICASWLARRAW